MANTHADSAQGELTQEIEDLDLESPEVLQTSLAAAMTLGLKGGLFYRNAKLTCLNLLMTYQEGCQGRCGYCGLEQKRSEQTKGTTFIRVAWPTYSFDLILERTKHYQNSLKRICLSMITHKSAMEDSLTLVARLHREVNLPISILCAPTLIHKMEDLQKLKEAGADQLGVSIDAATPEVFQKYRGTGVRGPHQLGSLLGNFKKRCCCFWPRPGQCASDCRLRRKRTRDSQGLSASTRFRRGGPSVFLLSRTRQCSS